MSRPSTTMPVPPAVAASTSPRWIDTRRSRTAGTALTALTAPVTASPRIGPATSVWPTWIVGPVGSVPLVMTTSAAAAATAAASFTSMPASSTAQVIARYMAPVSR